MEVNVERLKELRRERVLSLRELEERSGVSYNTIWRIEDGRQGAHPRTVRKLAEALDVHPSELVRETEAWARMPTARVRSTRTRGTARRSATGALIGYTRRKVPSAATCRARPATKYTTSSSRPWATALRASSSMQGASRSGNTSHAGWRIQ